MVSQVTEIIAKDLDNDFQIIISDDSGVVDFTAVTRMTIEADGVIKDSDIDASAITWDSLGVITFKLGDMALSKGFYSATLIAFDPAHSSGQLICSPRYNARLNLNVI